MYHAYGNVFYPPRIHELKFMNSWHFKIKYVPCKTGWKPVVRLNHFVHRFTQINTEFFL